MARSALLNVMVQAAMKAGRGLARDFGEVQNLQVSRKGPADFVSNADLKAEKTIYEELKLARPDYGYLMEESGSQPGVDPQHRWIVDPLDGTTNFLHGIPFFAVSIALERDGQVVAGVIYNPALDELYAAERGTGAFFNDRRMRVANRSEMSETVIGTGIPFMGHGDHVRHIREQHAIMGKVAGIRRSGAAALDLAFVAAGRFDGFWEHDLKAWDMAAGIILIREAGGFVSDLDDRQGMFDNGNIVAGNAKIHKELIRIINRANA